MAESERLFFALWPEPQQQHAWADLAESLLPPGRGRLLPAQNLHITLLYLGEVESEIRLMLEQKADAIQAKLFELKLERFGHWRRPQVLWWGPKQTPEPLQQLVDSLRQVAQACGIEVEHRPYQAHLTLARKVRHAPGRISAEPYEWQVDEFALVRSTLLPEGAHYEVLRRWPLGSINSEI
jgi:2'-5' RNA ligase